MKLLFLLAGLVTAAQAPKAKHNPQNIIAVADFPQSGTNLYTKGYVFFTSHRGGSVRVHVDMTGLPQSGGPFYYHIHENQVFSSEDCEAAGAAFDPFDGVAKCPRVGDDSFCQVGDLSGKHGWINATCFQSEYTDPYLALNPSSDAYIVGRSLVFHSQDSTRFACANINIATKEQYQNLFGYNSAAGSEGVLEFSDLDGGQSESSEAAESSDSFENGGANSDSGSPFDSDSKISESKDAAETSEDQEKNAQIQDSDSVSEKAAEVSFSNSSDEYVPAEAGAGNLFQGIFGTALGLVLGFLV